MQSKLGWTMASRTLLETIPALLSGTARTLSGQLKQPWQKMDTLESISFRAGQHLYTTTVIFQTVHYRSGLIHQEERVLSATL